MVGKDVAKLIETSTAMAAAAVVQLLVEDRNLGQPSLTYKKRRLSK
jgi:hypothetical protein